MKGARDILTVKCTLLTLTGGGTLYPTAHNTLFFVLLHRQLKVLAPHVPMRVVEAEVNATRVRHLGVVQPLGMFVEGSTVCVLFRLVAGRDLLDTLNQAGGRFPEERTRRYMWQVCSIVAALW